MILKKIIGFFKYPEFSIDADSILLFKEELSAKSSFKEYKSIIGKPSQIHIPGNKSGEYPIVNIYDHYGLVINEGILNDKVKGIEVYFAPYQGLKFEPSDPFKGKLTILDKQILPFFTVKNIDSIFSEFVIDEYIYSSVLDVGTTRFSFGFDDQGTIRRVEINFLATNIIT